MDTIVQLVLMIISAWLAYMITSAERRGRMWSGTASVGIYLALFGGLTFGLLQIWAWLSPKLTDTFPSENDQLFVGIVVAVVLIVLALDLYGKLDLMGKIRGSING